MSHAHSILVVDDDPQVSDFLIRYLELEGYRVDTATDWISTRRYFNSAEPDLVVLDLGLPDVNGLEVADRLRKLSDVGIIVLTGSDNPVDKIVSLESGADDFVQKPFDERELLARIRSVLRRRQGNNANSHIIEFAGYRLDTIRLELSDEKGELVNMTQGELQLLTLFVDRANEILNRDDISDFLTSRDWMPTDRSIDMKVSKLRKKLGDQGRLIKTVRGKGYLFAAETRRS